MHGEGMPRRVFLRVCALCSVILTVPSVSPCKQGLCPHHGLTQPTRGPLQSRARGQGAAGTGTARFVPGVTNPQVPR